MGHIQDTWYRTVVDAATGKQIRKKTKLYGKGQRYRVRYRDPDGAERSKSFPDRQKKAADDFLVSIENDKRRGTYINPDAGEVSFRTYAERWLESQTFDESSREAIAVRLGKNVFPHLGSYALAALSPTHIRTWDREMQKRGLSPNYRHAMFFHVQTILNAQWMTRRSVRILVRRFQYESRRFRRQRSSLGRWAGFMQCTMRCLSGTASRSRSALVLGCVRARCSA